MICQASWLYSRGGSKSLIIQLILLVVFNGNIQSSSLATVNYMCMCVYIYIYIYIFTKGWRGLCEIFTIETTLDGRLIDKTKPYTKLTKYHFVPFKKQKTKTKHHFVIFLEFSLFTRFPPLFVEGGIASS